MSPNTFMFTKSCRQRHAPGFLVTPEAEAEGWREPRFYICSFGFIYTGLKQALNSEPHLSRSDFLFHFIFNLEVVLQVAE